MKRLMLWLISAYQRWISPAFPRRCRYEPTCSRYAAQAVRELGFARGSIVAVWRVLRCNPLSHGGLDDVADRKLFRSTARDLIPHDCTHAAHARRAKPEDMRVDEVPA